MDAAILIAPAGASGPLRGLVDRLASIGVTVTAVEDAAAAAAAAAAAQGPRPPAVMLDLRDAGAGEDDDVRKVTEAVQRTLEALPHALPIVLTAGAPPALIVAALRAGAGDVLDILVEGTAATSAVVQRICQRQADRRLELSVLEEQRAIIEEMLKDLIRTERRAIDAEDALAARTRNSREMPAVDLRPPAVLVVEHDRGVSDELTDQLEGAGLATFAYVSGEEATREVGKLAETSGLDLAIVAARLPGIDGIETVRQLRERIAGLPAYLVVGEGEQPPAGAAELGFTGFVMKPLANLEQIVEQMAELARESRSRTREALYLQRIKERHERILERYRSLPRAP